MFPFAWNLTTGKGPEMSTKPKSDAASGGVHRHNHLAAAEMGAEQNYNQIDGVINNVEKPSILEQLRQNKPPPPEHSSSPDKAAEIDR
jgi:hypothetical protein